MKKTYSSVLSIAGFDPSGGAGIQADTKTISALGCYATNVLTALPVQNTMGVQKIYPIPYEAVQEQIKVIFEDIAPDAVKIGMIHTAELAQTIFATLKTFIKCPVVFDPVMVATSGHQLIEDKTIQTLIETLIPLADIITPNLDEAAVLAEMKITSVQDMYEAGSKILNLGANAVLIKGGHLQAKEITSLLFSKNEPTQAFQFEKIQTKNTHGSGCTLSSAIASYLALGKPLSEAVKLAQDYTQKAILFGKDITIGKGNGPLNHLFNPQKMHLK